MLAWAAGFFDGEGCVSVKGGCSLLVAVNQLSRAPLDRMADILGGKVYGPYDMPHDRPRFLWAISSGPMAKEALGLIYPFLTFKRPQVELALSFPLGRNGHPPSSEDQGLRAAIDLGLRALKKL